MNTGESAEKVIISHDDLLKALNYAVGLSVAEIDQLWSIIKSLLNDEKIGRNAKMSLIQTRNRSDMLIKAAIKFNVILRQYELIAAGKTKPITVLQQDTTNE